MYFFTNFYKFVDDFSFLPEQYTMALTISAKRAGITYLRLHVSQHFPMLSVNGYGLCPTPKIVNPQMIQIDI